MSHESTKLKQFELARFQFKFLHGTDGRDPGHSSVFFKLLFISYTLSTMFIEY